jgi:hypothetical protein
MDGTFQVEALELVEHQELVNNERDTMENQYMFCIARIDTGLTCPLPPVSAHAASMLFNQFMRPRMMVDQPGPKSLVVLTNWDTDRGERPWYDTLDTLGYYYPSMDRFTALVPNPTADMLQHMHMGWLGRSSVPEGFILSEGVAHAVSVLWDPQPEGVMQSVEAALSAALRLNA